MAPPCRVFPTSTLETEVQLDVNGKRRKGGKVDLSKCELLEMVQYDCQVDDPDKRDSPVRCWPVQRWFRRCQDKRGSFMVETTYWEKYAEDKKMDDASKGKTPASGIDEWVHLWKQREAGKP